MDCREERLRNELDGVREEDAEADDLAGEEVHDSGEIHRLPVERDVREIRCPDVAGVSRELGEEEVGEGYGITASLLPFPASPPVRLHPEELHDPSDPFPVDAQVQGEAFVSVARVIVEHGLDLPFQAPVLFGESVSVVQE